jgi:hypothetical protein
VRRRGRVVTMTSVGARCVVAAPVYGAGGNLASGLEVTTRVNVACLSGIAGVFEAPCAGDRLARSVRQGGGVGFRTWGDGGHGGIGSAVSLRVPPLAGHMVMRPAGRGWGGARLEQSWAVFMNVTPLRPVFRQQINRRHL